MGLNKWVLLFAAILLVLAIIATPTSASSETELELVENEVSTSNLLEVDVDRRGRGGRGGRRAPARAPAAKASKKKRGGLGSKLKKLGKKLVKGVKKALGLNKAKASAKKANKQALKANKKAVKAAKKAAKLQAKAVAKGTKSAAKAAKKAVKAAKKAAKKAKKLEKKAAKKQKLSLSARLAALARQAYEKAKRMGLTPKQIAAFVKAQQKKAKARLSPKPANKVQDPLLKRLLKGVKKQTRKSISKLQAALKKKRAGSVSVPIAHHKITIHPRTPRAKKLKIHKPSPTDKNYVKHLENTKKAWLKKIKSLKGEIHAIQSGVREKKDWPIELGLLDPPDASQAALAKELIDDFKPFLKDAKSIKQADLEEGRQNIVVMEKFRNELRNKLDKAKATPLLPDIYRFIE